jgi:hypothetical protein
MLSFHGRIGVIFHVCMRCVFARVHLFLDGYIVYENTLPCDVGCMRSFIALLHLFVDVNVAFKQTLPSNTECTRGSFMH